MWAASLTWSCCRSRPARTVPGDDDRAAECIDAGRLASTTRPDFDKPVPCMVFGCLAVERQWGSFAACVNLHLARAGDRPAEAAGIAAVVELESEVRD